MQEIRGYEESCCEILEEPKVSTLNFTYRYTSLFRECL